MKYIDAEKIRTKIDRMLDDICEADGFVQKKDEPRYDALAEVLDFLDTLEEEPDKDLEEAARNNADSTVVDTRIEYCGATEDVYFYTKLLDAFIAGAQWQEKRNKETIKTAEDHAFLAGADWQKEQMLKDAVEGKVYFQMGGIKRVKSDDFENPDIHFGDKVKLIIVKEDENESTE